MKRIYVYMAAFAVCATSCSKNGINEPEIPVDVKFTAVSETFTKTVLGEDGTSILWKAGDEVSIFAGGENLQYTASSDGASSALTGQDVKSDAGAVWAVYPYSAEGSVSESGVTVKVPATHNVKAAGFAEGSNVAVAYVPKLSENTELEFKNVCSYLKITFKASQCVDKVVLSSETGDVALAGSAVVKMNADGIPEIAETENTETEVTLASTEALDGTYLIPVLPAKAAKWKLTFTKTDGTVSTAAMGSTEAAFERNTPLAYDFSSIAVNWKVAPTAVTADKVFWSDAHISWSHEGKADGYKVYVDGNLNATVGGGEKTAHITGIENGTSCKVTVAAVYGAEELVSGPVDITTGKIRQLTRNVSPTSAAVGIENRAGALSGNYKPCLYVQLFESEDISGTPKYEAFVRDNDVLSDGHPFYKSLVAGSGTTYPPLNLAFGGLEPGKDYWFRVKSVASDSYRTYVGSTVKDAVMTSQNGDSEYSQPFKLTTAEKHVASGDEVLFEGFDDCFFSADFINCAVGLMPASRAFAKANGTSVSYSLNRTIWNTWEKNGRPWAFHGLRTGLAMTHLAAFGFLNDQKGDTVVDFDGNANSGAAVKYWVTESKTSNILLAPKVLAGARIGSFKTSATTGFETLVGDNRFMTLDAHFGEGYVVIGKYYDYADSHASSASPTPAAVVVKAVDKLSAKTKKTCTVSFRALAVQGRSGKITVIHLDRDAKHREATTDLWDTVTEIKIANSNGNVDENASEWSAQSETHRWYEYSFDIDLLTGDLVGFTTDGNSCICIDDIKIVLK